MSPTFCGLWRELRSKRQEARIKRRGRKEEEEICGRDDCGPFSKLAAEFAGDPEGREECDEGGESYPVGPERGARDDWAWLGEGFDFVDE